MASRAMLPRRLRFTCIPLQCFLFIKTVECSMEMEDVIVTERSGNSTLMYLEIFVLMEFFSWSYFVFVSFLVNVIAKFCC